MQVTFLSIVERVESGKQIQSRIAIPIYCIEHCARFWSVSSALAAEDVASLPVLAGLSTSILTSFGIDIKMTELERSCRLRSITPARSLFQNVQHNKSMMVSNESHSLELGLAAVKLPFEVYVAHSFNINGLPTYVGPHRANTHAPLSKPSANFAILFPAIK